MKEWWHACISLVCCWYTGIVRIWAANSTTKIANENFNYTWKNWPYQLDKRTIRSIPITLSTINKNDAEIFQRITYQFVLAKANAEFPDLEEFKEGRDRNSLSETISREKRENFQSLGYSSFRARLEKL